MGIICMTLGDITEHPKIISIGSNINFNSLEGYQTCNGEVVFWKFEKGSIPDKWYGNTDKSIMVVLTKSGNLV